MEPETYLEFILPAAEKFFPDRFSSKEAQAMLLAIGLQETGFRARAQEVRGRWWLRQGPASGFFQFEPIGIEAVLEHHASRDMAIACLKMFGYPEDVKAIHRALVHNDLLAAIFARLALWRSPRPLPTQEGAGEGWTQYLSIWRPGKPHIERWTPNFNKAWEIVNAHHR